MIFLKIFFISLNEQNFSVTNPHIIEIDGDKDACTRCGYHKDISDENFVYLGCHAVLCFGDHFVPKEWHDVDTFILFLLLQVLCIDFLFYQKFLSGNISSNKKAD